MKMEKIQFDSASELQEFINRQRKFKSLYLGEDSIVVNSATAFIIEEEEIIIGLFTEGICKPECIILGKNIFIGFNKEVVCISKKRIINRLTMDSVFYEFEIVPETKRKVVAIFELGIACFDEFGILIWKKFMREIVNNVRIEDGNLYINTEKSEIVIKM